MGNTLEYTPTEQVSRILRRHVHWYLRDTNRGNLIPEFGDHLLLALVSDVSLRAGGGLCGIWHGTPERQRAFIERTWKTRVSRVRKFCPPELIDWYVHTHISRRTNPGILF